MRRKTRSSKTQINQKLIIDVILASLIVQKAPALISTVIPLNPNISNLAGVGAGWVVGVMAKKPDISNTSLALGITSFLNPLIDSIAGPMVGAPKGLPIKANGKYLGPPIKSDRMVTVDDYINLNDYQATPGVNMAFDSYNDSY